MRETGKSEYIEIIQELYLKNNMRIAILITAYKSEKQLKRLVVHLSSDFDVYVHIDARSKINLDSAENVYVFKVYNTYWGSINTVLAVLYLLKYASLKSYDRYIQITGMDLPIKSNSYISQYFVNNNKEYMECFELPASHWRENGGLDRISKFWPLEYTHLSGWRRFVGRLLNDLQQILYKSFLSKLFLRKINYRYYGGSNYMDLTNLCVQQILKYIDSNPQYIKSFLLTKIPEEIFFQTIVMTLSGVFIDNNVSRFIDWTSGPEYPKIFEMIDYERIENSPALFARKFDENIDNEIIDAVYAYISRNEA